MRTDKASIYLRLFQKAWDDGMDYDAAGIWAEAEAERIYWELVDRGRQEAKDRDHER